jgi:hypothetical protein
MVKANTYAALSLAKTKNNVKEQCHKIFGHRCYSSNNSPDNRAVRAVIDSGDSMSAVSLMPRTFSLCSGIMIHETPINWVPSSITHVRKQIMRRNLGTFRTTISTKSLPCSKQLYPVNRNHRGDETKFGNFQNNYLNDDEAMCSFSLLIRTLEGILWRKTPRV